MEDLKVLTEAVNQLLAGQRALTARVEKLEKFPEQLAAAFRDQTETLSGVVSSTDAERGASGVPAAEAPARLASFPTPEQ